LTNDEAPLATEYPKLGKIRYLSQGIMVQKGDSMLLAVSLAALIAALVVAGCGGGGNSDPLTKSEFVEQANSICKDAAAERDAALEDVAKGDSEFVTEAALPPVQKMTEELSELVPPVGDKKEVQAIVAAFRAGIKKVEADPTNLVSDVGAFAQADKLATEYGLTDCVI
jgi:hypothetical protein